MQPSATIEIVDPSGDAEDPKPRRNWLRWLRIVVVVTVLGGFGALVAWVYYTTTRDAQLPEGQIPLVRADPTPYRTRPDNPGGTEVPHQNFEVYNRLGQPVAAPPPGRQVERLLPPPEVPMPRPQPAPPQAAAAPPPAAPAPPQPAPAAGPRPPLTRDQVPPPAAQPTPRPDARAAAPSGDATPRAPATSPTGRGPRLQLGALPSQEAAAREVERLRRTYGDIIGRVGISVVAGEARGNPIYRIQSAPLRDQGAADELCGALRQRRVECIIVRQ